MGLLDDIGHFIKKLGGGSGPAPGAPGAFPYTGGGGSPDVGASGGLPPWLGGDQQPQTPKLPPGTKIVYGGFEMPTRYVQDPGGGQHLEAYGPTGWVKLPGGVYQIAGSTDRYIVGEDGTIRSASVGGEAGVELVMNDQGLPLLKTVKADGSVEYQAAPVSLLEYLTKQTGSGGGGGGVVLPDPGTAATLMMKYYEDQIAASNGQFDAGMAVAKFQQDWNDFMRLWESQNINTKAQYELSQAQLESDARQRQLSAWQTQQQEATQRANILASKVLPSFVPGLQAINLPFVHGAIPAIQMKPSDVFSWAAPGVPGLGELPSGALAAPALPEPPQLGPPPVMPSTPPLPQYPAPPEVSDLIGRVAAGFTL